MVMMRCTHAMQHHYVKESLGLSVAVSVSPTAAQKNKISILDKDMCNNNAYGIQAAAVGNNQ
jgi:hypothetical protein